MTIHKIDARGLKCIGPTLKLTSLSLKVAKGDQVEITADCKSFEKDVRDWCGRNDKVCLWVRQDESGGMISLIQY